jgi:NAD(P)-dependent dehydrogenase (short-subunit alcohol dehydrogenase family)
MPDSNFAIYPSIVGKTVLVTGGGSGIGAAMTEAFHGQNARVTFLDIADDPSTRLVERLHGGVQYVRCDLTDIKALRDAISQVAKQLGPISILINNAGNDDRHPALEVTPEYWDGRMAVNLRHIFFTAQSVFPLMKELGGGSIVNLSSTSWIMGEAGYPAYTTAKAGIWGLTRSLSREFGKDRIRVNAIMPGWVMTERQLKLWIDNAANELIDRSQALPDRIQPEDIAHAALFLASDDSRMYTGQQLVVDGGWV